MIDIGVLISLLSSIIALIGVYQLNQLDNPLAAKKTWFWSNSGFEIYFAGRCLTFWDGGLGDIVMFIYFFLMWASNALGLLKYSQQDPLEE